MNRRKFIKSGALWVPAVVGLRAYSQALTLADPASGRFAASGVDCSGTWSTGSTERFESGAGAFCTSGWTETDSAGALSTYATDQYVTGTHSMKVVEAGVKNNCRIAQNIADDSAAIRFYFRASAALQNNEYVYICNASNDSAANNFIAQLRWYSNSGTMRLDFMGTSNIAGPTVSLNTWYRVEVAIVRNSTCTLQVYDIGSTTPLSGGPYTVTGNNIAINYWNFGHIDANQTRTYDLWFDNVIFSSTASIPIGPDE